MKRQVLAAAFVVAGAALITMYSNCSQVAFTSPSTGPVAVSGTTDPAVDPSATPTPTPPPVVCDPFDPNNAISATSGLKGSISYLDSSQIYNADGSFRYTASADVVSNGHKVDADLFLNSVNVPTRAFSAGFSPDNGAALKNGNGETLIEFFGLSLKSQLKLGSTDQPGNYEVAILSDDGSTLVIDDGTGFKVANEGAHGTTMACSTRTISMTATNRLPLSLTYFQGPRMHIALVMMWRRIGSGEGFETSECGKSGNDYFWSWDAATSRSVPQSPVNSLLSRGWKILTPENFELTSGTNKCQSSQRI